MNLKIDPVNLERNFKMTKIINRPSPIQSSRDFPETPLNSPETGLHNSNLFGEYLESEGESDSSPVSLNRQSKQESTHELLARHSKEQKLNLEEAPRLSFEKKKSNLIENKKPSYVKNIIHIGAASLAVASFFSVLSYGIGFFLDKIPGILKNNI
jgi:hypothetical protein